MGRPQGVKEKREIESKKRTVILQRRQKFEQRKEQEIRAEGEKCVTIKKRDNFSFEDPQLLQQLPEEAAAWRRCLNNTVSLNLHQQFQSHSGCVFTVGRDDLKCQVLSLYGFLQFE